MPAPAPSRSATGRPTRSSSWSATRTTSKKTPLARVIYRHIKETATPAPAAREGRRRRRPQPEPGGARRGRQERRHQGSERRRRARSTISASTRRTRTWPSRKCAQALKYLVDYAAIADTIMKNNGEVHQTFLPKGFLGALDDNPYKLDVAKAKELLAKAGLPDGFTVTMDTRTTSRDHRHRAGDPADAGAGRHQARDHPRRRQADADQVPRPPARHLYRPLGLGLSGPELQRRHLRGQRRQLGQREGQDARLAQCLGSGPADGQDPRGRARDGRREARRDVQGTAEGGPRRRPVRRSSCSRSKCWRAQERRGLRSRPVLRHQLRVHRPRRTEHLDGFMQSVNAGRRARQRPPLLALTTVAQFRHRAGDDPSRAARRHLLHRPRRPDRSGARHRRRPRAGQRRTSARAQELGLDLPLCRAVRHLREEGR